ncbi:flagellar protein FlaG [Chitinimonas taiwanensis]|jgi:flagellar protein FlaG|uniref:Flagellar protein FlaG n=1 Tax=Chitinimonas taiwanensis DSM 18899 TaxID=1121279 RepID=A0A1K2HL11_9NEIS|nr:flagellar protein FlaG [Chitinimonas taiwanensis]SFZ77512.1 flagellar protein FlaG [Chitinimonas taiwanensis DSM 18899]
MRIQAANVSPMPTLVGQGQGDGQAKAPAGAVEAQVNVKPQATAEASTVTAAEKASENQRSVQESVKKLNETIAVFNRSIQFSIDDDTSRNIVRIVDVNSKEVIRQIPSQEVIEIAQAFDKLKGLLFSDKA